MVKFERSNKHYYKNIKFSQLKQKQQGVVLVVSLVFLVALTAVASVLMLNTTTDMKMSGASQEKMKADQETLGAMDELIFRQVRPLIGQQNIFALPIITFANNDTDVLPALVETNTQGDVTSATVGLANNTYVLESDCPHSRTASSTQVFTCNVLRVQVTKSYGRRQASTVQINSGIAQQLLR